MNDIINIIKNAAPYFIEPVKFAMEHQTGAVALILLVAALYLFHKSGVGRYVYPWLLRTAGKVSWWAVRTGARLMWSGFSSSAKCFYKEGANLWRRRSNSGAKPVKYSPSISKNDTPAPLTAKSVELPSAETEWVVRALKAMGFTAAEARTAASKPEVMAAEGLDDQVRAALNGLNPMVSRYRGWVRECWRQ